MMPGSSSLHLCPCASSIQYSYLPSAASSLTGSEVPGTGKLMDWNGVPGAGFGGLARKTTLYRVFGCLGFHFTRSLALTSIWRWSKSHWVFEVLKTLVALVLAAAMGCSPVIIIRSTSPAANSFSFMRPSLCCGPIFNFRSPLGWNCDCNHGPRGGAGDIEFSPEFIDSLAHSGEADAGGSIRLPALQSCRC